MKKSPNSLIIYIPIITKEKLNLPDEFEFSSLVSYDFNNCFKTIEKYSLMKIIPLNRGNPKLKKYFCKTILPNKVNVTLDLFHIESRIRENRDEFYFFRVEIYSSNTEVNYIKFINYYYDNKTDVLNFLLVLLKLGNFDSEFIISLIQKEFQNNKFIYFNIIFFRPLAKNKMKIIKNNYLTEKEIINNNRFEIIIDLQGRLGLFLNKRVTNKSGFNLRLIGFRAFILRFFTWVYQKGYEGFSIFNYSDYLLSQARQAEIYHVFIRLRNYNLFEKSGKNMKIKEDIIEKKKSKEKSKRIEFTPSAKRKIIRDCNNFCAFPNCIKRVVSTKITIEEEKEGWFQGHIAHIYPASRDGKGGFRYDEKISENFIKSRENGFLLCVPHHDEIDNIINKKKYTAETLLNMREAHLTKNKYTQNDLKQVYLEPLDTKLGYNDKRIPLLEVSIKNLTIKYYSEDYPQSCNIIRLDLLNIINKYRPGYLERFATKNSLNQQDIINYHFTKYGKNLFPQIFQKKIKNREVSIEKNVKRDIFIHAGDLAYGIYEKYNRDYLKNNIPIDHARIIYNNVIQGRHNYIAIEFNHSIFNECLDILERNGIIKISGHWTGDDCKETYDIYNPERLQPFIEKFSLEVLLDSIHK